MRLPFFTGSQDTKHCFTLAESARLMPVIASLLLATSSAKAGLISCKPAAARHGDTRKPAVNVQATSTVQPQPSTVAWSQSGFARIRV